jgi:hypothetical protein
VLRQRHRQGRKVDIIVDVHVAVRTGAGATAAAGEVVERAPEQAGEAAQAMDQLRLGQVAQADGERIEDSGQLGRVRGLDGSVGFKRGLAEIENAGTAALDHDAVREELVGAPVARGRQLLAAVERLMGCCVPP